MVSRVDLLAYLKDFLDIKSFKDYAPNGLQVEGCDTIEKFVSGVTASQALIDKAVNEGAHALLVHHGFFWKGENPEITGIKKKRIAALLNNDINLLAYHLPLDAHLKIGNNAELARLLDFRKIVPIEMGGIPNLLWHGKLQKPEQVNLFKFRLENALNRAPLHLPARNDRPIETVAWCTGAAERYIDGAAALGVDAFISGEVCEQTTHLAKELDVHYFACGHHATERYGVQALGEHIAKRFGLSHTFLDIDNPV